MCHEKSLWWKHTNGIPNIIIKCRRLHCTALVHKNRGKFSDTILIASWCMRERRERQLSISFHIHGSLFTALKFQIRWMQAVPDNYSTVLYTCLHAINCIVTLALNARIRSFSRNYFVGVSMFSAIANNIQCVCVCVHCAKSIVKFIYHCSADSNSSTNFVCSITLVCPGMFGRKFTSIPYMKMLNQPNLFICIFIV